EHYAECSCHHHEPDRQYAALRANWEPGAVTEALGREPFGTVVHALSPFGGRPRLRGLGALSFTPRSSSASRSRHSIWALTLRSSAAAQRSTAAHRAGSVRSG